MPLSPYHEGNSTTPSLASTIRNGSVIIALFVCALSLAGSIYLIVEMDQPYSGFIKLSSAPVITALDQLGRP